MKLSNFLKLNILDFTKGLFLAVITAVLTVIYDTLNQGNLSFDWTKIALTALTSAIGYILNRFVSNSQGQLFKDDKSIGGGIKNPKP